MSRLIKATPVERLVEAYLKRLAKTNKVRHERAILEKAAKMIGIVLNDPCCPGSIDVIVLGRQENFFIVQLRALLNGIDERKHRESLERAKKALENAVTNPCCNFVNSEFTGEWDSPNSIDFNVMRTFTENDELQGEYPNSWGGNIGPSTISGMLNHGNATDKIEIEYTAVIPSGVSICVHLKQNGVDIQGYPVIVNIPGPGTDTFVLENLKNKISGTLSLHVLVDTNC